MNELIDKIKEGVRMALSENKGDYIGEHGLTLFNMDMDELGAGISELKQNEMDGGLLDDK